MAELQYKLMTSAVNNFDCGDVAFYDCISEISDYQIDDFGEFLPSLYINYLAIGTKYQKNKIGTKTLEKIINEARQ